MKKQILKNLFLVLCILSPFFAAAQNPIIVENFNYTAADTLRNISGAGWISILSSGLPSNINKIPVVTPGLSYTGSTASGIGNAVAIKTTGEDIGKAFAQNYRDNAIYTSFLINVSAAQATGDYFFAYLDSALSGTNYRARTFIKTSGTGFKIGISKSGAVTAAGYYATDLSFNTTYQIVVKYSIITGVTNDSVKLFVNPVLGAAEPTTANAEALTTETDITISSTVGIGGVALRQGTLANAPTLTFDGLKVGRSWSSVTALTVKFNPTILSVNENAGTATVSLDIINPNAAATTVEVKIKGGSATAGSDYTFTTQTVTFPANATAAQTFTIPIIDDATQEGDETIQLVLRNAGNAGNAAIILADSILNITIPFNDISAPVLGFAAPVTITKKEGTSYTFDVTIATANINATSVDVVLKSTATATSADYTGLTQTITFPANTTANQSKTISITADNLAENDENIVFVLRNATNSAVLTADSILTITIPKNDQPVQAKFVPTTSNVLETAATAGVSINVLGASSNANATTFQVVVKGGTATAGTDYTFNTTTVTIPAYKDSTINLSAAILNDMLVEGNETIILAIRNISNAGVIGADSILTITLNDDEVPFYPISDLRVNDSNGNPIFPLATPLAIRGVVYSPNLRAAGLQFSLVDATGAMTIFKATGNLGYTVTLGDSLAIYGKLSPYNGLNEVAVDSFKVLATGIALKAPKVVTKLKEEDESNIVKVLKVRVIDPAQWTKTGSGFNVKITNGTDSMDMRILNSVDLYTMDAPIGDFNVTGVVSQFDASNPKNSGYQLMPRGSSDIYVIPAPPVDPTVAIELGSYTTVEGAGTATIKLVLNKPAFDSVYVNFDVAGGTATPGADYSIATPNPIFFNIGDSVKTVTINVVNDIKVETPETINVEISNPLGATLGNRTTAVMTINDNDTLVGINTNAKAGIAVYPNPAHNLVNIKTVETITKIQVINAIGQIVLEKFDINNNFSSIELKTIESGVYTILVSTENGVIASKFIKQ
jgi:hypothetical protein